jgi:hypothetical protein
VEFDRPSLAIDLASDDAPGLEWGSARDVLDRTTPDLATPLLGVSASEWSPFVARPWLRRFTLGVVARFRPQIEGADRWKLLVADSKGQAVASFAGKGRPPREITWDGRSSAGSLVTPGLTYSYLFEAYDRAGNKREFLGEAFKVQDYRLDTATGPLMVLSGRDLLPSAMPSRGSGPYAAPTGTPLASPILAEAASCMNQYEGLRRPIRITCVGRSYEQASLLGALVSSGFSPLVLGDLARIQVATEVEPDAPEGGVVRIAAAK